MPERSSKLKQICLNLRREKIDFFLNQWDWNNDNRFRYEVLIKKYTQPKPFPTHMGAELIGETYAITRVYDELEHEYIEIPYDGHLVLRIRGHEHGSKKHGWITEGALDYPISGVLVSCEIQVFRLLSQYRVI